MASRYLDSIPLPPELPIVLDKLIKAVLRDQPKNIVQYCALYFQKQNKEMGKSRNVKTYSQLKQQVTASALKYFGKEPPVVPKEEIIKFVRVFAAEKTEIEPYPNSIQQIMHQLSSLSSTSISFFVFINTVTDIFNN